MRMMIFFDLPTETSAQRKAYRHFVKYIKEQGFLMMQKSVYIKLAINNSSVLIVKEKLRYQLPRQGNIALLVITEKQFSSVELLVGENIFDTINSEERLIEI